MCEMKEKQSPRNIREATCPETQLLIAFIRVLLKERSVSTRKLAEDLDKPASFLTDQLFYRKPMLNQTLDELLAYLEIRLDTTDLSAILEFLEAFSYEVDVKGNTVKLKSRDMRFQPQKSGAEMNLFMKKVK